MVEEKKPGNPYVPGELCESHRDGLNIKISALDSKMDREMASMAEIFTSKVDGIKGIIVVGLSISTVIISLVMYVLRAGV